MRFAKSATDWERLRRLSDDDIRKAVAADPAAAPLVDASWFAKARYVPPPKAPITIKLDRDVRRSDETAS
jgi:hypothetical protein